MKSRNWFWGVFFLLAAVFVIACQVGAFVKVDFISIVATVLLVALLIHSLINLNYFGIFLPVALLYMIYQKPLGLIEINIWLLLVAAVFASIGFSFLFHPHHHEWKCCVSGDGTERFTDSTENIDDNNPYAKVSFGSSSKYLHGDALRGGKFTVSFGELQVYFDQAQLSPDGAEVSVDCSFGDMKLFIPRQWQIIDKIRTSLGSVENNVRSAQPDMNAPKLTLIGNVSFGDIEIHYI